MSLANLLATQQRHVDTLVELLLREQDLLIQGIPDGEQLTELARLKQTELKAIDTIETGRRNAQQKLGYEAGLRGAEQAARDALYGQDGQQNRAGGHINSSA